MYSWKALISDTLLVEDFLFLKDNSRLGNRFPKGVWLVWLDKPPEIQFKKKKI